jgi:PKD domain/Lactonase, 7-bladed beta-propeller
MPRPLRLLFLAAALCAATGGSTATAGTLYTNNYNDEQVAALSFGTDGLLSPLAGSPFDQLRPTSGLAITPDGRTLVESFAFDKFIGARSLADDGSVSAAGGELEVGITNLVAIGPDGRFAYVSGYPAPGLLTFAIGAGASLTQVGGAVGSTLGEGAAITPDGRFLFQPSEIGPEVERFSIGADGVPSSLGKTPTGGERVAEMRVTPDGRFAIALVGAPVKDRLLAFSIGADGSLTEIGPGVELFDTSGAQVIVAPSGKVAYVTDNNQKSVTAYSIGADGTLSQVGSPTIAEFSGPDGMAMSPDGRFLYLQPQKGELVQAYSVAADGTLTKLGPTAPTGGESDHTTPVARPAVPVASLSVTPAAPHAPASFDASASTDVGAAITGFRWNFGDGATKTTTAPLVKHPYKKAGVYAAKVTVVDDADCTGFVYTGQSAYCDGEHATATSKVDTLPAIFGMRARAGKTGRVSFDFKLSEKARVAIKIRRRGSKRRKPLRRLRVKGKAGKNRARLKGHLRPGRYLATAIATDSAGGSSAPRTAGFKVRRRR